MARGLLSELDVTQPVAYTGSPIQGNNTIQFGATTAAGIATDVVVTFGKAFAVAPTSVVVSPAGSSAVGIHVTGIAAGSFTFAGAGSNISHTWIACGSGRL